MFLKRLDVIGFKSFADRIGIDFVPGVTAVVGPNGSGKSNVTDAIRWVLGEQSAKSLRGAKMEDVIFSGSDSRKALNFAEVTLILDNGDERLPIHYNEVSVTRRVYRSGESEYLLNKQACRLKDITDLFLDSGLGKEAFSIISQGRVDEILNSRPDDRRSIFEEAAGVLKYKKRRKKAEHKLFETDDNLKRVLDILHELDERIEPLQIQAATATDYLEMTKELRDIEVAVMIHDIEQMDDSLSLLLKEQHMLSESEKEKAAAIAQMKEKLLAYRANLTKLDDILDVSQVRLVDVSSDSERLEGRLNLMAEKRSNASAQMQKIEQTLEKTVQQKQQWQALLQERTAELTQHETNFKALKQTLKSLENSLNRSSSEIELEIEQWKNTYIDRLNEQATAQNELKNIAWQLEQQSQAHTKMSDQSGQIVSELSQFTDEKQQVSDKLAKVQFELKEQLEDYKATQQNVAHARKQFEEKQDLLYKGYKHVEQMKTRKETLEELEADFSGFYQGVKAVLVAREKGQLTGIHGAVAELIQVDGTYALALETALGGALQHIVTQSDSEARHAIQWLKKQGAGRATFLPQNVMKSRKIAKASITAATSHPAFINTADELATFDEQFRTIAENLLGNVIVAKDLKGATQIAQACNYRYRVVTLDGDIVNAGGSMSGGSTKKQTSLFSRKTELETLSAQLIKLEADIQHAEKVVSEWKEKVATQTVLLEQQRNAGEQLRVEEFELNARCRELEVSIKRLAQRVSMFDTEQEDATTKATQLKRHEAQFKARLKELEAELISINMKIEELTDMKHKSESARDELQEQYAQKRSEVAALNEKVTALRLTVNDLTNRFEDVSKEERELREEMTWLRHDGQQEGPSEDELRLQIQQLLAEKQTLLETIQTKKDDRLRIQSEAEQLEQQTTEQQRLHESLLDGIRNLEVKLNRVDVERQKVVEALYKEYSLTFEEAMLEPAIEMELDTARRKVKLLRQSIAELGPINVQAIEEYEAVSERHTFLTNQRNDLVDAQETLHEAIREMDEEMTARFKETFDSIRMNFLEVFRELFGGGNADLQLLDPTNLLETGIEIVAQPPGKKLQNLSLLSGGERALTAIALLFAILKTRPVPFCILDEVEAALDESNVVRYSQYLKKFSDDTQFIVITHRKGTMEGADVLYGITMQESGVSKLVSVKLEQETIS